MEDVRFAWPGGRSFGLEIDRFALVKGERLMLIGPSGTGKSTFLSLLCGVVLPVAGRITVQGVQTSAISALARDRFRAEHFGVIFQMFNLLPYASVLENILLPLSFAPERRRRAGTSDVDFEARRLLRSLGLDEGLAAARADALSVGQQQRVAAARALIGRPEIIVADEPTSALDPETRLAFLDLLFSEVAKAGSTLVLVSHDPELATRFTRVERLSDIARVTREAVA